jgi:hypothetical protein
MVTAWRVVENSPTTAITPDVFVAAQRAPLAGEGALTLQKLKTVKTISILCDRRPAY